MAYDNFIEEHPPWQRLLSDITSANTATIEISENGEYDVRNYAYADVNVSGGSSDFAIANVTISATESGQYGFLYSVVADISESYGLEAGTLPPILQYLDFDLPTEAQIFEVCMYQGNALFAINIPEQDVTLTGNATKHGYDVDDALTVVTITGDCIIVVTPESNG